MDLIRKMSGLRSSQELSPAVVADQWADSDRDDEDEEEEINNVAIPEDAEQDDGDVFEDAATSHAPGQQQQQEEEENSGNGEQLEASVVSPIRVRAPVTDEAEDDTVELDNGPDGGDNEEDGGASFGSGESFDSALERIASSSTTSYDTSTSPKMTSPVGSLREPVIPGSPTPPSRMTVSQQGALMRLNEMLCGDASLDTSIIDNSTSDEFKDRLAKLAGSRGQSLDDASFDSILEALLPLVNEKQLTDGNSGGPVETNSEAAAPPVQVQSPMPRAKLSVEDEPENVEDEPEDYDEKEDNSEHDEENGVMDDSEGEMLADDDENEVSESNGQKAALRVAEVSSDLDQVPKSYVNSVSETNGGNHEGLGDADAEPLSPVENGVEKELGSLQMADSEPVYPANGEDKQEALPLTAAVKNGDKDESLTSEVAAEAEPDSGTGDDVALNTDGPVKASPLAFGANGEDSNPANDRSDVGETKKVPFEETVLANHGSTGGEDADDSDLESEEDEEESDLLMDRSSALDALVRAAGSAAVGAGDGPSMGSAGPSLPARPIRPGRSSLPSLDPAPRVVQQRSVPAPARVTRTTEEIPANADPADGNEETREKLEAIRVKFLRLALRLGQSPHNVVVAQVLYRLGLAEQLRGGRSNSRSAAFSFERTSGIAEDQEAAGPEELDFSCTIMLLGKTGVGKSATINSIFDEVKTGTNAFKPSTNKVQVITGLVHGIKVRVIDTPGLLPCIGDQRRNEKVMASVKGFIKKQAPDIVLYFDRLDLQSRDFGDLPLLRTITDIFGAAVWFNAIVVLTHASSAPPDGPNGLPLSYEMFVAQRSHVVQQTIRQAAGDMRLMNPVSLVENHPACRVNRSRERVLPNGQVWKPQLLLLCFASKILTEANTLLKLQDNAPGRPFGVRPRAPPLPFLLSSLIQSRAQLKMPDEQVGDEDESDEELEEDEESSDDEEYDQLPPFRRLAKEEIAELDEETKASYFGELAERERLFQKKQWKEELKRRRGLKKRMAEEFNEESQFVDDGQDDDLNRSAAVPVAMPDMVLPPSFDSDNPSHRYRYLESANQWIVRPVLETHGWDHDNGYDGMSLEKMFVIGNSVPASVSGTVTKDKKEASLNMECAASVKHGEGKVTLAGVDIQSVAKDFAYTVRSETRFSNFKGNKTTGGLALTALGDTIFAGMKIEDRLVIGKRVKLVVNGGAITGRGDVAYGGSLEASLRDKDYPLSRILSTLGISIMDWNGGLAIGGNFQSQFPLGKTMMVGRANLNNRGAGQISIRASSSEQMHMALIGLLPIIRSLANRLLGSQSQQ